MKTLVCDCNRSMTIDAPTLRQALTATPGASADGLETVHSLLCRREAGAFQRAAQGTGASAGPLVVACTQERRLFVALNDATEGAPGVDVRPIRFVNLRETGGWSRDGGAAAPKMAALLAAAQRPDPEPVATVSFRSAGRCLVIGAAEAAARAVALLDDALDVSVLVTAPGGTLPQRRDHVVHRGRLLRLAGWLGAFDAEWETANPIDLDACTRCNACIAACPEGAIDFGYQVDLDACRGHRDCVRACDAAGAIDFARARGTHAGAFDVVLDLRADPAFAPHASPQGYVHARPGDADVLRAAQALRALVGTFETPRYVRYRPERCAHSRNEKIGCSACIDVCAARAIRSDAGSRGRPDAGDAGVIVEPHLCAGCGACATVCPSGALAFAYPGTVDQGARIAAMLAAYAHAGGRDAALLIHDEGAGAGIVDDLGRAARVDRGVHGVPARVLPVAVRHTASVGLDLWLAAIAHGARQVWVLVTGDEAPGDRQALVEQMAIAQALLTGLGLRGAHFALIEARDARDLAALDAALRVPPAQGVRTPATFAVQADKRGTLELAIEHLRAHAPAAVPDEIPLPAAGAPFGGLAVDASKCTLCLSCVGACPAKALLDHADAPQLRFIERNCVQCGLCAVTCPEGAIALQPRLWLADEGRARRDPRVLAEMAPFRCVRCDRPFGTLRAVENVIARLAGHAAFQGAAAQRLRMCADCRVVDQFEDRDQLRITELKP